MSRPDVLPRPPHPDRLARLLPKIARAAALLGACSCAAAAEPQAPPPSAPIASGPEAEQAIAIARGCARREPEFTVAGFEYESEPGTARHVAGHAGTFLVELPPGKYLGRLPPPRPGGILRLEVHVVSRSCKRAGAR